MTKLDPTFQAEVLNMVNEFQVSYTRGWTVEGYESNKKLVESCLDFSGSFCSLLKQFDFSPLEVYGETLLDVDPDLKQHEQRIQEFIDSYVTRYISETWDSYRMIVRGLFTLALEEIIFQEYAISSVLH